MYIKSEAKFKQILNDEELQMRIKMKIFYIYGTRAIAMSSKWRRKETLPAKDLTLYRRF